MAREYTILYAIHKLHRDLTMRYNFNPSLRLTSAYSFTAAAAVAGYNRIEYIVMNTRITPLGQTKTNTVVVACALAKG